MTRYLSIIAGLALGLGLGQLMTNQTLFKRINAIEAKLRTVEQATDGVSNASTEIQK